MQIFSNFDGGNIQCISCDDPSAVQLRIQRDNESTFYQWFFFKSVNVRETNCRYVIENAGGAAYPGGWSGYRVVASYDREFWFRVDTHYQNEQLIFEHQSSEDQVYFAYFAPYSMERHADLVALAQSSGRCVVEVLGTTLDGQSIDCLRFGEAAENKRVLWMVARQHPGETMAEWWMEGLINRLVDHSDAVVNSLLEKAVIYLVPNMNPDGSRRGHLRTNAVGSNLNREWANPTLEKSPEVLSVLSRVRQTGVDFALDVHGDESLPFNFIAGTEGIPSWDDRRQQQLTSFKSTLAALNPDFQTEHGYPPNAPGEGKLSYCSNALAEEFGILAMTLEMPFKDAAATPDLIQGWSPERCAGLAVSCLDTIHLCWSELFD